MDSDSDASSLRSDTDIKRTVISGVSDSPCLRLSSLVKSLSSYKSHDTHIHYYKLLLESRTRTRTPYFLFEQSPFFSLLFVIIILLLFASVFTIDPSFISLLSLPVGCVCHDLHHSPSSLLFIHKILKRPGRLASHTSSTGWTTNVILRVVSYSSSPTTAYSLRGPSSECCHQRQCVNGGLGYDSEHQYLAVSLCQG